VIIVRRTEKKEKAGGIWGGGGSLADETGGGGVCVYRGVVPGCWRDSQKGPKKIVGYLTKKKQLKDDGKWKKKRGGEWVTGEVQPPQKGNNAR